MDLNRLSSGIAQSGLATGLADGLQARSARAAPVTGTVRGNTGSVQKVGGLAAVAGIAWKAYQSYRDRQPGQPWPPTDTAEPIPPTPGLWAPQPWRSMTTGAGEVNDADTSDVSRGLLLVRAIVAAAKADGHIDDDERARILAKVESLTLSAAEKELLLDELTWPLSLERLAAGVQDLEAAVELYTVSVLAVDATRPAGRAYLEGLEETLALPASLVREVHAQASAPARLD